LPVKLEDFAMDAIRSVVTDDAFMDELRARAQDELKQRVALFKPTTDDDMAALKRERVKLQKAAENAMDSLLEDENSVDMVKTKLKKWTGRVKEIDRTLQRVRPAPGKADVKELGKECMAFFSDRVIGPTQMASGPKVVAAEEPGSSGGEGDGPERQQGRACVAELKQMFRLINVRADYDPDGKEGTLEFSPFQRCVTG